MQLRSLCLAAVLLTVSVGDGALLQPRAARAEARLVINQPRTDRQIELKIHLGAYYGYSWYDNLYGHGRWGDYAIGPGVQMLFPIVKNAISSLNNPMYLGFFVDLMLLPGFRNGFSEFLFGPAFGPVFQWRFVILDMFDGGGLSAFANIGFGLWPWLTRGYYCNCTPFYFFPLFELGANLMFTRRVGMTLSFGYPAAKLGLNLAF
jgi:hypothetical protein